MSDGETIEEAITNAEDAKRCWIAVMKEAGRRIPPPSAEPLEGCSGKWRLRTPKSLHRRLAKRAKREGRQAGADPTKIAAHVFARIDPGAHRIHPPMASGRGF
jgi:hypothetical protein